MKDRDWSKVDAASDLGRVPVGGYICKIVDVVDDEVKDCLQVKFDIVEGTYKDYYKKSVAGKPNAVWYGRIYRSCKESCAGFFKRFLLDVEQSNTGFSADAFKDPRQLVGKMIGVIYGEEEYRDKATNEKRTAIKPASTCPVPKIRDNTFNIPKKKLLKETQVDAASGMYVDNSTELPF